MHHLLALTFSYFLLLFICSAFSRQFNITIDDQDGDPSNGNHITYTPPSGWNIGQNCTICVTKVAPQSDAYLGTWTDATYFPAGGTENNVTGQILQASVDFVGTAVYVVCILTGTSGSPNASSDMTFVLDGTTAGTFERQKVPNSSMTFDFNHTVFSTTNLSNDAHTLQIQTGLNGQEALILLDAIIYTKDDDDPDSDETSSINTPASQPTLTQSGDRKANSGAIVGGSVAAVISVSGVLATVLFCLRTRRQSHLSSLEEKITPLDARPNSLLTSSTDALMSSHGTTTVSRGCCSDTTGFSYGSYGTQYLTNPSGMTSIDSEEAVNGSSPDHAQPEDDLDRTSLPAYSSIEQIGTNITSRDVSHSRQTSSTSTSDASIRKYRERTV